MRATFPALVLVAYAAFAPASSEDARLFEFQSNFWVNLHHVLRGDARRRAAGVPVVVQPDTLEAAERAAWSGALDAYADLATRDSVFDSGLRAINNNALTRVKGATLPPNGIPAPVRAALAAAAPVYRAHVWPDQSRANEAWIAAIEPVVTRHGAEITARIAAAYDTRWPREPVVVDVTSEAGRVNAYTIDGPPGTSAHSTIASGPESHRGDMGVEIVFHEASHAIDRRIMKLVEDACARQHVTVSSPDATR